MNEGRVAGVIIIVASGNFKYLAYVSDKRYRFLIVSTRLGMFL